MVELTHAKHTACRRSLDVGFKVENERAVQFCKWANQIVKGFNLQSRVMDVGRLEGGGICE